MRKERKRSSLNGKIKDLGSYGKYGRASSYPGQRSKRRQKVRTQVHAGQLEKVREEVPNIYIGFGFCWYFRSFFLMIKMRQLHSQAWGTCELRQVVGWHRFTPSNVNCMFPSTIHSACSSSSVVSCWRRGTDSCGLAGSSSSLSASTPGANSTSLLLPVASAAPTSIVKPKPV